MDLCLSVFPWAKLRRTKAAIKLHALLDKLIDAFHEGILSQDSYEHLVADVDARLLQLESGEEEPAPDTESKTP